MQQKDQQPGAKRLRQQQFRHGSSRDSGNKRQRFWPCPVCSRSFALFRLEDHVNQCLDSLSSCSPSPSSFSGTAIHSRCKSPCVIRPVSSSPSSAAASRPRTPLILVTGPDVPSSLTRDVPCRTTVAMYPALIRGSDVTDEYRLPMGRSSSPVSSLRTTSKLSAVETKEALLVDSDSRQVLSSSPSHAWNDEIVHSSGRQRLASAMRQDASCPPTARCLSVEDNALEPLNEPVVAEGRGFLSVEGDEGKAQVRCKLEFSGNDRRDGGTMPRTGDSKDVGFEETGMVEDMRDGTGRSMDRPPAGFKLFQKQVQSQARLSMFLKFSSASLQRKATVTVLQPGMVLFRSWLALDTQQKLVQESQGVSHLFHRPTTSGGGKYHVYSMCWGPKWDAKAHRYVSKGPEQLLPPWMFELSQKLAWDAHQHTSVYPSDSIFTPDVGLVNFYPVKADELGVIGIGGHQDLDDSSLMPVVSVSVGDTMTFYYRRLPPLSRRKGGMSISVDEKTARSCEDGDAAHNMEHQIFLESGDVLVFGGQSRLVYHGTRHVQPGTRPPGLHMVPGRLNFTFRQTISKAT